MPEKKRQAPRRTAAAGKPAPQGAARAVRRPSLLALTSGGFGALRERVRAQAGAVTPGATNPKAGRLSAALERLKADYARVLKHRR
jgi:hypothetical protein